MAQIGTGKEKVEIEENLVRHMVLNLIRKNKLAHSGEYGELIISCDHPYIWRKGVFPYYKIKRKLMRDDSQIDWDKLYRCLHKVADELKSDFPYRTIEVEGAESDDVIGALINHRFNEFISDEKVLILSGDHDFVQLQVYKNVKQYNPVHKKFITPTTLSKFICKDAQEFIYELIMKGDTGDSVPNFLSCDQSFAEKIRQKPLMEKKLKVWLTQQPHEFCTEDMMRNFKRNEQLVDLSFTPKELCDNILKEYDSQAGKDRDKLYQYFFQNRLMALMSQIGDF